MSKLRAHGFSITIDGFGAAKSRSSGIDRSLAASKSLTPQKLQGREMQKPGPTAQVNVRKNVRALRGGGLCMELKFIPRFQRFQIK